jgi:hypothetical protein
MPRFVILRHETPPGFARPTHWDFMLECGGALRTWALGEAPSPGCEIVAEELPDHRLTYLDYEGEVSCGRGIVTRWDAGTYEIVGGPLTPRAEETEASEIRVAVRGQKTVGEIVLSPMKDAASRESSRHTPRAVTGCGTRSVPATLPRYWKFNWKGS